MHYHCEIWFEKKPDDLRKAVDAAMAPFYEYDQDGNFKAEGPRLWDWYQIGGRWRGAHDPEYDAEKDETLVEKCEYCDGFKKDCRYCDGKGRRLAWPTGWPPHEKDLIEISELTGKLGAATLIVRDETYDEIQDVVAKLAELGITTGWLVTVDYHS